MENNFTSTIKEFLIDELEERKGCNTQVYISDLAYNLTEYININGSVHCSTYKAIEFIKENFEDFGNLIEFAKNEFEILLNPFLEAEEVEVFAYIEGVRYLLNELKTYQELEENNQEIILTDEIIDKLIKELEENEFEIEF